LRVARMYSSSCCYGPTDWNKSWKLTFGGSLIVSTSPPGQNYSLAKSRKVANWFQNIKTWSHSTG
jgi:hypothetical protein